MYNGWDRRRVHLIFDCLYGDARVPIRQLHPEEVVVQARRSVVVLPSHERLREIMDRVLASRGGDEPGGAGGEVASAAASVASAASAGTSATVSQEDRDRDDDARLMLATLAQHDPLRQEARDALRRLGHRREDGVAKAECVLGKGCWRLGVLACGCVGVSPHMRACAHARVCGGISWGDVPMPRSPPHSPSAPARATRAVASRAEQMGGPATKQRLLFVCRRFAQGELPDAQMLQELETMFAHTLQRTMEQVRSHGSERGCVAVWLCVCATLWVA